MIESGDARGFIPLYCEKLHADALIIGSRGLGGIKRCVRVRVFSAYSSHTLQGRTFSC